MYDFKAIAESNNFIVLDTYVSDWQAVESYQTESDLERELVQDLATSTLRASTRRKNCWPTCARSCKS